MKIVESETSFNSVFLNVGPKPHKWALEILKIGAEQMQQVMYFQRSVIYWRLKREETYTWS